jgi:CPA2 family monovalent cation:H+ antiporter-2
LRKGKKRRCNNNAFHVPFPTQTARLPALADQITFLLDLGILAVSALVLSIVFARLKLPMVSGQVLAGMIVGPGILGLVRDTTGVGEIQTIGIVLLLFIIGLELDPVELRKIAGITVMLTLVEASIAFGFGLLASYVLNLGLLAAIVFAMAASISSTAIVGKVFLEKRMLHTPGSRILVGLLIMEDIAAVVFLIVLSSLIATQTFSLSPVSGILRIVEIVVGGFALVGLAYGIARYLAPKAINYLSHYEEEFEEIPFLFALGLGFMFGILAAYLDYSPGIGAFIIGLSMRGKQSKFLSKKIAPIKDLFVVLFFVSMGSLINPFPALALGLPILLALTLVILGKFVGGFTIGRILSFRRGGGEEEGRVSAKAFGAWLIPRGEFSFVIGQLGVSLGLVERSFFSLIGLGVLITAIAGPLLQRFTEPRRAPSVYPYKPEQDV